MFKVVSLLADEFKVEVATQGSHVSSSSSSKDEYFFDIGKEESILLECDPFRVKLLVSEISKSDVSHHEVS